MNDTEAKQRTYNILVGVDQLLGILKVNDQSDESRKNTARLKLANALVWIRKNLDLDILDSFFQEYKDQFKHLKSIKSLVQSRTASGLHFDVIDRVVIYREEVGDELQEVVRIEKDGTAYFKGELIFRDKELYDSMATVAEGGI